MSSLMRSFTCVPRARFVPTIAQQPRRFAHSSYGNEQSGHEQGTHEKNPKQHMEHPGPKSPAEEGKTGGQSQSSSSSTSSSSSSNSSSSTDGAQPKIHSPKNPAEKQDPEVRKHNEEMEQRADRSANQLSEDDSKVDKKFWKGDVGDANQSSDSK